MSADENDDVSAKRLKLSESGEPRDTGIEENREDAVCREWHERLKQILSCPACKLTIRPPVGICRNGHSVCKECRTSLKYCPSCGSNFKPIQNLMLAQIAEYVEYPCLNANGGCRKMYYLREEKEHLKSCGYRVHRCKIENCAWAGSKEELRAHVECLHPDSVWRRDWFFSEKTEFGAQAKPPELKFLIVHDEIFWMFSKQEDNLYNNIKLYKNIQYVGSKETAKKFSYKICLKSTDGRRQYKFKSVMEDDAADITKALSSPNCAVFDGNVLRSFSPDSRKINLTCHYSVLKSCE